MKIGEYNITVEKKRIKSLTIKILQSGDIKISAPIFLSDEEIYNFAFSKRNWLDKHLKGKIFDDNYLALYYSEKIKIFGKDYRFIKETGNKNGYHIDSDTFFLVNKKELSDEDTKKYVVKYLKEILSCEIDKRLPFFEDKLKLYSSSYVIKNMKSRWGSCNIKTKKICFNLQLVKKEKVCLDYIIVHELGHLLNRNHDKKFHRYMDINFPDWKQVDKLLKI